MSVLVSTCISYHLVIHVVMASNGTSSDENDATVKALLTVGILIGCLVIALVVAKIVDTCYEHHIAISDNASDISEDTRKLLRLRLTVNSLWKKKTGDNNSTLPRESQRKIIRIWSARAKESRRIAEQRRAESMLTKQGDKKNIIRVEEAAAEAKLQAAASQFLAVPDSSHRLTPRPDAVSRLSEASKLSPTPNARSRANTLHKPDKAKLTVLPRSEQRSGRSPKPDQPETKKVLAGVATGKSKADDSSVAHVTSSANPSTLTGRETSDSDSEVLQIDLHREDPEGLQSAVDLGQDTVRSEANPDLVALSYRSDVSTISGLILQGLNTPDDALWEQQLPASDSEKPASTRSDPGVVVSHNPTEPANKPSQNCVVSLVSVDEDDEIGLISSLGKLSRKLSDFTVVDMTNTEGVLQDIETPSEHSHSEQHEPPDDVSIARPQSPTGRKVFTIVLPTEQPSSTTSVSPPTSTDYGDGPCPAKPASSFCRHGARAQSFSARACTGSAGCLHDWRRASVSTKASARPLTCAKVSAPRGLQPLAPPAIPLRHRRVLTFHRFWMTTRAGETTAQRERF